jgi:Transposase IS4
VQSSSSQLRSPCFGLRRKAKIFEKMSEEEFAVDEIWFGNQFRLNESQELVFVNEETQEDDIPEDNVALGVVESPEVIPESQQEIFTELETQLETPTQLVSTEASAQPPEEPIDIDAVKPRAKRNTSSFAKRFLLANRDIFLDPTYSDKCSDDSIHIVGQIKECPREANGKMYRVEWKNPLPDGVERGWLRCFLTGSKENRATLLSAMEQYDKNKNPQQKKVSATRKQTVTASNERNSSPVVIAESQQQRHTVFATPAPVAYVNTARATAASVRTSSTISSLSQNSIASPDQPMHSVTATRRQQDIESSSDDGEDLDEEDNIYEQNDDNEEYDADDSDSCDNSEVPTSTTGKGLDQLLDEVHWNFCVGAAAEEDRDALSDYNGPSGLKPRVSESFNTPFECLAVCGGLDYDLVSRLTRNSNEYARQHLLYKDRNRRLYGVPYMNITTEEMYHFLGITLRISLSPVDWGGYQAYFSSTNKSVFGLEIFGSDGFARHYMSLIRYKQIRAAFHPEDRVAGIAGDKCYQLRHVINTMNQAAMNTKFMASDLTFDEGGIGSRHRLNPVRQYNKDKPQKFRVDFFILACSKTYFIHHIDVYQGANASNVGVHRALRSMPRTQKAVLNAVLHTKITKKYKVQGT